MSHPITTLQTGILLGECPRWHDGRIWFADWVGETIYAVTESGESEVMARLKSLPISFDWTADGTCLVVNNPARQLQRLANGRFTDFADLSAASHGYNELVTDDSGHIYLNNVNFDFPGGEFRPGYIALVRPDGTVERQAGDLAFPNGMVITPDRKTLICAESFNGHFSAFDIAPDGTLSNQRLWAKLDGQGADGITMDAEGAIWASSGPRCVRIAEGGKVLDEIPLDRMAFACMLGGADGKTLFITANEWTGSINTETPTGRLYSTRVDVPQAGFPRA
jgi:sugar lactone lactonase YvrE